MAPFNFKPFMFSHAHKVPFQGGAESLPTPPHCCRDQKCGAGEPILNEPQSRFLSFPHLGRSMTAANVALTKRADSAEPRTIFLKYKAFLKR